MRALWIGLAVLAACSDADTNTLLGTWQIQQPAGWDDFRFTVTEAMCTGSADTYPCDGPIVGNATSNPLVCKVPGMTALSHGQIGYSCGPTYPISGSVIADDLSVNFGLYSDGARVDLLGRIAPDRSITGEILFMDPTGVVHPIGPCPGGPVCLDRTPSEVQFVPGGATVNAAVR